MDDLALAVAAAQRGAAVVRRYFGREIGADLKGRNDPVTDADRESEAAIVALLRHERPEDTIVAEESDGGGTRSTSGRRWFVDPLDGTVNFVHRIPQVSVSVALYEGSTPLVAVVLDVMRGEVFSAEAGRGAALGGTPIHVSSVADMALAVVSTGFPYDHHEHPDAYAGVVAGLLAHVNGVRRIGSAALDLAWVAAGRFEAHVEVLLAPWDIAAGTLLVREAGGKVTTIDGDDLVPEDREIVATNGHLHDRLRAVVGAHRPPHLTDR